jgi:tetratricopeptide (TPR) repeat protein
MKNKAEIISVILLLILLIGCASGPKSPETLAKEYTAKAQQYEKQGDLVEALKQYKLVLTVDPENELAQQKKATLEPQLKKLAEEHYKNGNKFYNKGEYGQARKEYLTALRYNPEHAKAKAKLTATSKDLGRVQTKVYQHWPSVIMAIIESFILLPSTTNWRMPPRLKSVRTLKFPLSKVFRLLPIPRQLRRFRVKRLNHRPAK